MYLSYHLRRPRRDSDFLTVAVRSWVVTIQGGRIDLLVCSNWPPFSGRQVRRRMQLLYSSEPARGTSSETETTKSSDFGKQSKDLEKMRKILHGDFDTVLAEENQSSLETLSTEASRHHRGWLKGSSNREGFTSWLLRKSATSPRLSRISD